MRNTAFISALTAAVLASAFGCSTEKQTEPSALAPSEVHEGGWTITALGHFPLSDTLRIMLRETPEGVNRIELESGSIRQSYLLPSDQTLVPANSWDAEPDSVGDFNGDGFDDVRLIAGNPASGGAAFRKWVTYFMSADGNRFDGVTYGDFSNWINEPSVDRNGDERVEVAVCDMVDYSNGPTLRLYACNAFNFDGGRMARVDVRPFPILRRVTESEDVRTERAESYASDSIPYYYELTADSKSR